MLIQCQDSPHISLLTAIQLGDIPLEMYRIVSCLKEPVSTSTLIQPSNYSHCSYQKISKYIRWDFFERKRKKSFSRKPIDVANLKLIKITNGVLHAYTANQNKSTPMS